MIDLFINVKWLKTWNKNLTLNANESYPVYLNSMNDLNSNLT